MEEMSSQSTIVCKLKHKKCLYTKSGGGREQYLPDIINTLLTEYRTRPLEVQNNVVPLMNQGLQISSGNASSIYAYLTKEGTARYYQANALKNMDEVAEDDTKFVHTGSFSTRRLLNMPDQPDDNALPAVLTFMKEYLSFNYAPSCVMLGAASMAVFYQQMSRLYENIAIPMAIGTPCSGKSTATNLALATFGIPDTDSVHDPTYAGVLRALTGSSIPFHWEDVEKFEIMETVTLITHSSSMRLSYNSNDHIPLTMPVCTSNGYFLKQATENKKNRLHGRLVYVPFHDIPDGASFLESLAFKRAFSNAKKSAYAAFPAMLSVGEDVPTMEDDPICLLISQLTKTAGNVRTNLNYGFVMYLTAKVMQKGGKTNEEIMVVLDDFFQSYLMPYLEEIRKDAPKALDGGEELKKRLADSLKEVDEDDDDEVWLVEKSQCKDCFGKQILVVLPGKDGKTNRAIRMWIQKKSVGCVVGKKTSRQQTPGVQRKCWHIHASEFPDFVAEKFGRKRAASTDLQVEDFDENLSNTD